MSIAHPWVLGLLPLVPLLLLGRWLWYRRIRRQQASLGYGQSRHEPERTPARLWLRHSLFASGLALLLVSLAGPRWGVDAGTRSERGADLVFCLDCSRSMLAEDLYPDRLAAARRKALDLIEDSPEHRMALVPFAAIATLRTPLTGDQRAIAEMLEECSPELFPAELGYQGTAIATAVDLALSLDRSGDRGQAIVVFSDGSDPDGDAVTAAAEAARAAGVPVYGLFLGDPEREITVTIDGQEQVMEADRSSLDELATVTGGISVNAATDDSDVRALRQAIAARVAQAPWEEQRRIVASERYVWFLLPALACLVLGLGLRAARESAVGGRQSTVRGEDAPTLQEGVS